MVSVCIADHFGLFYSLIHVVMTGGGWRGSAAPRPPALSAAPDTYRQERQARTLSRGSHFRVSKASAAVM